MSKTIIFEITKPIEPVKCSPPVTVTHSLSSESKEHEEAQNDTKGN